MFPISRSSFCSSFHFVSANNKRQRGRFWRLGAEQRGSNLMVDSPQNWIMTHMLQNIPNCKKKPIHGNIFAQMKVFVFLENTLRPYFCLYSLGIENKQYIFYQVKMAYYLESRLKFVDTYLFILWVYVTHRH